MGSIYFILLIILGVLLPLNGIVSIKQMRKFFSDNPNSKMLFYKQTIVIQIVITTLVFGAMAINQDSIDKIGLAFFKHPPQILGLLLTCLLGWWFVYIYMNHCEEHKIRREIERNAAVKFLLPDTKMQYRWSIGTSFAAGICEEIIFRGFLYWQLAQWLPVIPAILLTNIIFGLVHYGTGFKNAFLAFSLGVFLSVIFLYTESLWIPMMIHVLIDIYSMTQGKRYFDQNPENKLNIEL